MTPVSLLVLRVVVVLGRGRAAAGAGVALDVGRPDAATAPAARAGTSCVGRLCAVRFAELVSSGNGVSLVSSGEGAVLDSASAGSVAPGRLDAAIARAAGLFVAPWRLRAANVRSSGAATSPATAAEPRTSQRAGPLLTGPG